jgi:D-amino-acid dehydrogenase
LALTFFAVGPRDEVMKVLVIGSGLIGLTSAHFLRDRGYEIIVIDRQQGPGREASFANGALLSPSMPEPWNTPGCWRVLLGSLGRTDSPLQFRTRALPGIIGWGLKFLRNSTPTQFEKNTLSNLALALFSVSTMKQLRQQLLLECVPGSLKIFRNPGSFFAAAATAHRFAAYGLKSRSLSTREAIALEPALAPVGGELAGVIHYDQDEVGDAHRFCCTLTEYLRGRGVKFRFATSVSELEVSYGRVTRVQTSGGSYTADAYVVAAGSYSTPILRTLGLRLPVQPAKGYSVTFDAPEDHGTPKIPLIDDDMHAAIVPIGNRIRVAGTAEFAGYDLTLRPERIQNLLNLAERILPRARLNRATATPWCGLRPMSADGVPIIGRTALRNLWINTGHGHLGWTMAAGSGVLLAHLISDTPTSIDPVPYDPSRFA